MLAIPDYESIVALAEEAHFGRAARRLGVTQPALSARLRRIEEALDARLFHRDRGGVRATQAGIALINGAERVLAAAAEAERAARDARAGLGQSLKLGMTQIAAYQVVAPSLARFRIAHPHTRLRLTEATTAALERLLEAHTIDAAFLHPPLHAPGLSERPLKSVPMVRYGSSEGEPGRPLIRYPRAEAPVLMGVLSRRFAEDEEAGRRWPAAEADTMLGALVLSQAGFGSWTAPADYPSPFGPIERPSAPKETGISLETAIAWRSLDRSALLQDLVRAATDASAA